MSGDLESYAEYSGWGIPVSAQHIGVDNEIEADR